MGRVAALEEEGVASADPASGEDSQVRSGGCGWRQCVLSSGNGLLSEGRAEMLRVWVTWPFC